MRDVGNDIVACLEAFAKELTATESGSRLVSVSGVCGHCGRRHQRVVERWKLPYRQTTYVRCDCGRFLQVK